MKVSTGISAAVAAALLIGTIAATAHWVRAAPGAQAETSDDSFRIPLQPAKPYLVNGDSVRDHAAWVSQALRQMRSVHPGMTRRDFDKVFELAGGLSEVAKPSVPGNLCGVYSYRECPNFKVDVEFDPAHTHAEIISPEHKVPSWNPNDVIVKISRPFVDNIYSD